MAHVDPALTAPTAHFAINRLFGRKFGNSNIKISLQDQVLALTKI